MILGLLAIAMGNILIWQSGEETTQYFAGWVFGAFGAVRERRTPRRRQSSGRS